MKKPVLIVIDDDPVNCRLISAIFNAEGYDVVVANDGVRGIEKATSTSADPADVVLLDMHMPEMDGLQVLEALTKKAPHLPVVMLTASTDLQTAVRATRLGAYDYLSKPVDHDEVVTVVRRALEARTLRAEVEDLRRQLGSEGNGRGSLTAQMGPSAQVREIVDQVRTVAASRFTVLVLGETGTGKEVVAQAIHRASDRHDRPFIALDCGAIPEALLESELFGHEKGSFTGADRKKEGRFQLAEGGTLFLDEIGNLPPSLQAKLLRVLESQQVTAVGGARATTMNVRFIAATNDDLQKRVSDGQFRADLYFRLAQYTLQLPPLRARPADIPYLATRFAEEASIELRRPIQKLGVDALDYLQKQPWPGNVRELRNVVRQAVLGANDLVIKKEAFRTSIKKTSGVGIDTRGAQKALEAGSSLREIAEQAARNAEREAIQATLRSTRGNKSQAARALRTDYKTLHLKMKSLGIRAKDFEPS